MILSDEKQFMLKCDAVLPDEVQGLISKLEIELEKATPSGIGLAACQIGILKRAFIIRMPGKKNKLNFINPEIITKSQPLILKEEGCLSYPGTFITTLRYNRILIKDDIRPDGIELTGMVAIVAQHEFEHTNGESMFKSMLSNVGNSDICPCGSGKTFAACCKTELRRNMRVF
jgi:peptide deformylase